MPQIDIKLQSTANVGGFTQTSAKAQELQRILGQFGNNVFVPLVTSIENADRHMHSKLSGWERSWASIQKKFTAGDMGKQMLGALGIGSGIALAQQAAQLIASHWEQAARAAERIEQLTARQLANTKAAIRERQTTEQQLDTAITDRGALAKQIDALNAPKTERRWKQTSWDRAGAKGEWVDAPRALTAEEQEKITELQGQLETADREVDKLRAKLAEENKKLAEQTAKETADSANAALEDARKLDEAQAKLNERFASAAEKYRELADPAEKYRQQLAEIDALSRTPRPDGTPFLSASDAAAARARVLAEMNDTVGQAIRAARAEVDRYEQSLATLAANPYLTDAEKESRRMGILDEQTAAVRRLRIELEELARNNPALAAAIGGEVRNLGDIEARNAAKSQPRASRLDQARTAYRASQQDGFQTMGEGAEGGVLGFLTSVGTMADQLAAGIQNTLGAAVNGITQGIMGWVNGTLTFRQALANIGQSILQSMLQTIVQMGAQWLVNAVLVKTGLITIEATGDMLRTARVAKENAAEAATLPAKTAGAAASGISSFGAALAFGLLAVALIASLAGGFAEGGYTAPGPKQRPAGVVHAGEWVAPQWMVKSSVSGPLIASLEAMRSGSPGYERGGFFGRMLDPLGVWRGGFDAREFFDPLGALEKPRSEPSAPKREGSSPVDTQRASTGVRNYFLFDRAELARMVQEDSEGWFYDLSAQYARRNG